MARLAVLGVAGWLALVAATPASAEWSSPQTLLAATDNSVDTAAITADALRSTPAPGYVLDRWEVCGKGTRGDCSFTKIRNDTQATAYFRLDTVAPLLTDIRRFTGRCDVAELADGCRASADAPEAGTLVVTLLAAAVAKRAGPVRVRLKASRRGVAAARRARGRFVLRVEFRPRGGSAKRAQAKVRLPSR